jgi:1,2-diacylglycerol 3-alpha-glucosyltransferase
MPDGNVLLIWDRTGPYHLARALALRRRSDHLVQVADFGSADHLYQWSESTPDAVYALSPKPVEAADFMRRVGRFVKLVRSRRIRMVAVAGYARPAYLAILVLSRLLGLRVVLFAESWYPHGPFRDAVKAILIRAVCDAVFVSGQRARDHFRQRLRISEGRLQTGYSVVSNFHFRPRQPKRRGSDFLCVARFAEEKNLMFLVEAFRRASLPADRRLVLVGGGPLFESLEAFADERVIIRKWVPYEELPALYAGAEWFVLPSLFEPWGLVVNEAMAAGVPLLLSETCGCLPDLLTTKTGFSFDPRCMPALVSLLERAASLSDATWRAMSEAAMDHIERWTPDSWARALSRSFAMNSRSAARCD